MKTFEPTLPEEIVLDRLKIVAQAELSRSMLDSMEIRMNDALGFAADRLVMQLRAQVLSNPAGRIVFSFPATVWQMWKGRHFPKWALRRWPVREDVRVFSARAMYPEANIALPKELGPVHFYVEPEHMDPRA